MHLILLQACFLENDRQGFGVQLFIQICFLISELLPLYLSAV